jgi:hypothetical protein
LNEPCVICHTNPTPGTLRKGVRVPVCPGCWPDNSKHKCQDCGRKLHHKQKRCGECDVKYSEAKSRECAEARKKRETCPTCGGHKGEKSEQCSKCHLKQFKKPEEEFQDGT